MNRIATAAAEAPAVAPLVDRPGNGDGRLKNTRRSRQHGGQPNANENGVFRRLAAPFSVESISFKPQAVSGRKALAIAYLDARAVMNRLDEVLGPDGWQDDYQSLPSGEVKCTLLLRIGGEWISKSDVGSRSDQPDEGDQVKAAFSDSLKRAAVKWGIGRYLYHLPKQWVGYDPDRRSFTESPRLPDWAMPNGSDEGQPKAPSVTASAAPSVPPQARPTPARTSAGTRPASQVSTGSAPANGNSSHGSGSPSDGRALFRWLKDEEKGLIDDHFCRPGELVEHVAQAGASAGHGTAIIRWNPAGVTHGINAALDFIARCKGESAVDASADSPAGSKETPY